MVAKVKKTSNYREKIDFQLSLFSESFTTEEFDFHD